MGRMKVMAKKSFSIHYKGGEIWIEHLDGMNSVQDVKDKFCKDLKEISKLSVPSFIVVNLYETKVSKELITFILEAFTSLEKRIQKVVFIGLKFKTRWYVKRKSKSLNFIIHCMDDFEESKSWLIGSKE